MATTKPKTTSGSHAVRATTSPNHSKGTRHRANSQVKKGAATPAGKALDQSQQALDQAAKTEKQLRTALKKHDKAVRAAKTDLDRRDRDLQAMKSQLKTAKKSRKRAAKAIS
jgi:chromosome segregation ATPase